MDVDQIRAGQSIPSISIKIYRSDLIRYAAASDDYFYIHWDQDRARAEGFSDVIVHGWLSFAHMLRAVNAWLPAERADVADYRVRYRQPTYPGLLTCGGTVSEVTEAKDGLLITLDLWAKDATGEVKTRATATLRTIA